VKARRVLVRDASQTEMAVKSDGEAKGFAKQLIRDRKPFDARPREDGTWSFFVHEINHPSRWESE